MDISIISTDELKKELEKRKKEEKQKAKPKPLSIVDHQPIYDICNKYIDYVDSEDFHEDNDWERFIYETVLETIFGNKIWEWIVKKY